MPALLLGALLSALPYLALLGSGTFQSSHIMKSRVYSASPFDFLIPSTLHPLWGDRVSRILQIDNSERTIYLGVAALILAIFALRRDDGSILGTQRRRAWLGVMVLAAIFALGTDLHLGREPLSASQPIWLPAYYLGQLPFAGIMRVWARFGLVSILFVALLAGVGVARWMERIPRANQWPRHGVALLCAALVLLDWALV